MYVEFSNDFNIVLQPFGSFISSRTSNNFDVLNKPATKIILELLTGDSIESVSIDCLKQTEKIVTTIIDNKYGSLSKSNTLFKGSIDTRSNILKTTRAEIEITNRCNLNCTYCYAEVNRSKYELSTKKWIEIFNGLESNGLRATLISGGEPFIRKDMVDILAAISKKLIVEINTNGKYITAEIAEKLSKMKLKRVQVSLDSVLPEYHDLLRGKNSHRDALSAIKNLTKYKIPTQISMVVTQRNEDTIPDMENLAKRLGATLRTDAVTRTGNAKKIPKNEWVVNFSGSKKATNNTENVERLPEMNFIPVCQSQIGYVAVSHTGILKPCNMREGFFEPAQEELLVAFESKWWEKPYGSVELGFQVQKLITPKTEDSIKMRTKHNKYLCDLQTSILVSKIT